MSVRLYVGNLPKELERQELESVFSEFDDSISTKVITDRKTGKCRGFGFVTVKSEEQADQVIEKFNGYLMGDSAIKIERAQPRAKGKEEDTEQAPPSSSAANNRRNGSKNSGSKSRKVASTDSEAVQPDPRWAQDLEKLKQLLAAQAANP